METINKSQKTPSKLKKHAKKQNARFDNMDKLTSSQLRETLLNDQGYICCYCQRRIPEEKLPKSKIEHFKCQDKNKELQLKFYNLFIACNGQIGSVETCDTAKHNDDLYGINLLDVNLSDKIKYTKNGVIYSDIPNINKDLELLNLNDQNLKLARESICKAIKSIKEKISRKPGNNILKIQYYINDWKRSDNNGKFKEYKGAGIYFLK